MIIIANNNKYWKTIKFKNFNKRIVSKGLLYDYWNTFENIKKEKLYCLWFRKFNQKIMIKKLTYKIITIIFGNFGKLVITKTKSFISLDWLRDRLF